MTTEEMLRWCENQNQLPMSKANGWWYYVARNADTGLHYVQKLEGGLGEEVQKFSQGWRSNFVNWSESDLRANDRKLNSFMLRGLAPAQREFAA